MVAINSHNAQSSYFKLHLTALLLLGIAIFPIESKFLRRAHFFFAILQQICMLIPSVVCTAVSVFYFFEDFTKFMRCVCMFSLVLLAYSKIVLIYFHKDKIRNYMVKIEHGECFKPNMERGGLKEFKLIESAVGQVNFLGKMFYTLIIVGASVYGVGLLSLPADSITIIDIETNSTIVKPVRAFALYAWFPFGLECTDRPVYDIVIIYELTSGAMLGSSMVACDSIVCGFMSYLITQFLFINNILKNYVKNAERKMQFLEKNSDMYSHGSTDEHVLNLPEHVTECAEEMLKRCAYHHQQLVIFCGEIADQFSLIIMIQFSIGVIMIFTTLLVIVNADSKLTISMWLSMASIVLWEAGQIFHYCYLGNEIKIVSGSVSNFAYDNDWVRTNESSKKILLLIMLRSQRPCKFTAGMFQDVNLDTFISVMKGAYSYFMALQQFQDN